MANLSSVSVKLSIVDEEYEPIEVDFDAPEMKEFCDAFARLSYDGEGQHLGGGKFCVCGRWNYGTNLEWNEYIIPIMALLRTALGAKGVYLHGNYADSDYGMDWCGFGEFSIDIDNSYVVKSFDEVYSYDEYAKKFLPDLVKPTSEEVDTDDGWENMMEYTSAVESSLDDKIFN